MNSWFSAPRVFVYSGVFATGAAAEDWRHRGWAFNLAVAALAFFMAFLLDRKQTS